MHDTRLPECQGCGMVALPLVKAVTGWFNPNLNHRTSDGEGRQEVLEGR